MVIKIYFWPFSELLIFKLVIFELIIFELVIFELIISEMVIFHHFLSSLAHICIKKNIFLYHRIDLNIYGALEKIQIFKKFWKSKLNREADKITIFICNFRSPAVRVSLAITFSGARVVEIKIERVIWISRIADADWFTTPYRSIWLDSCIFILLTWNLLDLTQLFLVWQIDLSRCFRLYFSIEQDEFFI